MGTYCCGATTPRQIITTQSFIPFLLDGNKSPESLRPPLAPGTEKWSTTSWGMGNGKNPPGTSIIELKKDGVEEYLTIGVGMPRPKGERH